MKISSPYKPVSTLRLTLVVMLAISVLFPLLFAYINNELNWETLSRELVVTPIRVAGITLIVYGIISLGNLVFRDKKIIWLRYFIELPLVLLITYGWMVWTLQHVEGPLRCGNCFFTLSAWNFRQYISLFFVASVFIYIFQSGLNIYKQAQQKAAEAEQFQKECAVANLQALKNQVNPHFLFNSLSVLTSLVHVSAETSDRFIQQLSKAYRYIIEQKDLEWVTLQAELDFLDSYFFLLQIRFGQKIQLNNVITVDTLAYSLPPLTLQLLIENAVKHNKMSATEPLTINLSSQGEYLVIKNNLNKREGQETSTGIGLDNIQKRYAYLTDKRIEITATTNQFIVQLPLIKLNPAK